MEQKMSNKTKIFSNPNEVNVELMKSDRLKKNLDQSAIADAISVSQTTVSSWEMGRRLPKVNHVIKFAALLGEDPRKYVKGDGERKVFFKLVNLRAVKKYINDEDSNDNNDNKEEYF